MLTGMNEDLALPLLLPRQKVPKGHSIPTVTGKTVMITGAGGSIGSELAIQCAGAEPECLILLDSSEAVLYEIDLTLSENAPEVPRHALIGDVRDMDSLQRLFEETPPDLVFHAAALKHVPLLENDFNMSQALRTNLLGTINVARCCADYGSQMILISTDKAVYPRSFMGCTKRLAEMAIMQLTADLPGFRASFVRFGNVIGSSGSVIPMFRRQIAQGGPVTVTHPDMTRYMMSIQQAVTLVLHASVAQTLPNWDRNFYILDMGEPVRILDMAKTLIRYSGQQVDIELTGVRPGEKLTEDLWYHDELISPVDDDQLFVGAFPGFQGFDLSWKNLTRSPEELFALMQTDLAMEEVGNG